MKIIEYTTCIAHSARHLDALVNQYIQDGWTPIGGPCVSPLNNLYPFQLVQALVKYEEAKKNDNPYNDPRLSILPTPCIRECSHQWHGFRDAEHQVINYLCLVCDMTKIKLPGVPEPSPECNHQWQECVDNKCLILYYQCVACNMTTEVIDKTRNSE